MSSIVFILIGVVIALAVVAIFTKLCAGEHKKAKKGEKAEIMKQLLALSERENSTSAMASPPTRNLPSSIRSAALRGGLDRDHNSKRRHSATSPNSSTLCRPNRVDAEIEEQIRQRAYELYQARGGVGGKATDDWQQAKKEVLSQKAKSATTSS